MKVNTYSNGDGGMFVPEEDPNAPRTPPVLGVPKIRTDWV